MTSRSVLVPWVLMRSVISPFCLCQNSIAWHQLRFGIFLWIVRILVLESKKNRTSREFLQHDWGACFSAFFFVFQEDFQASPRLPPGFPQASPRLPTFLHVCLGDLIQVAMHQKDLSEARQVVSSWLTSNGFPADANGKKGAPRFPMISPMAAIWP